MVGASVNGLLGVDAELQRSAVAAQNQSLDYHSVRVTAPLQRGWDCPDQGAEPRSKQRV